MEKQLELLAYAEILIDKAKKIGEEIKIHKKPEPCQEGCRLYAEYDNLLMTDPVPGFTDGIINAYNAWNEHRIICPNCGWTEPPWNPNKERRKSVQGLIQENQELKEIIRLYFEKYGELK